MNNQYLRHRRMTSEFADACQKKQEQAQKPVAWRWKERINDELDNWVVTSCEPPPYAVEKQPLYTAPRQWHGLTDKEIEEVKHSYDWTAGWTIERFARQIEAKIREKNT